MKRSLLLYLTILFALTTIFTYAFLNSEVQFEQNRSEKKIAKLKDSLSLVTNQLVDANYFSLATNENALYQLLLGLLFIRIITQSCSSRIS